MRRRFWVSITLGLLAYVLLPLPGSAEPLSSRIHTARQKIDKKKYKEHVLSETIAIYNVRIKSLQGEIRGLQRRQTRIQATLDEKRAELLEVRSKLEAARDRLARLRRQLVIAEEALADRLVELYKADEPDALTVVLAADGFADLLERTDFLERISKQDSEIVEKVRVLKARAQRAERLLADLERRKRAAAVAILRRRDDIASVRDRLASAQGELRSERNGRRVVLAKVRSQRRRAQEDLTALEREQAKVRNTLAGAAPRAFAPGAGPIRRGSGRLIWPISGPLTSPFGMRWGRLHAGIDISAPSGTPIRAADSGRVVLLGFTGGYGNYTCVQHTGSMSTCYAHQSGYNTSSGAGVRQGQVIGYVGNTGHSFGAHLHFEVRINGSPVDPLGYL